MREKAGKRYGVIACSRCKRAWGIDLSQDTTKCPACGKKYIVQHRKVIYCTSDLKRLQRAVGHIQEQIVKR